VLNGRAALLSSLVALAWTTAAAKEPVAHVDAGATTALSANPPTVIGESGVPAAGGTATADVTPATANAAAIAGATATSAVAAIVSANGATSAAAAVVTGAPATVAAAAAASAPAGDVGPATSSARPGVEPLVEDAPRSSAKATGEATHPAGEVAAGSSGAAAKPTRPAESFVQLGDRRLFAIRVSRAGVPPEDRARRATRLLEQLVEVAPPGEVRVMLDGATAVVFVGARPLIQLTAEDAAAADDVSLAVHAEDCAAAVREGMRTELRRRAIAQLFFSISLIVLMGLASFLLLGAVSKVALKVAALLEAQKSLPELRIGKVEVVTPAAMRVAISTSISVAKPVVQLGILCSWLLFSLSLLPATEAVGRRITGFVLAPLATLLGRLGAALPVVVLVAIGAFALAMLLRFLRIFFESVAQGGIHLRWLSPEQALPASVVARAVTVIAALLAAAPLIVGDSAEWGALRIGGVALTIAAVLAASPSLANTAAGTIMLFGRRLAPGIYVEIGPHSGRITSLTLTDLRVQERSGAEVRVPHLMLLFRPLRILGDTLPAHYEVTVDARAPQGRIRKALVDAVRRQGRAAHVELVEIEGQHARYLVVAAAAPGEDDLASAIADALTRDALEFSRIRKLDA
jgi:small-conductance mechanosensitive channel